MDPVALWLLSEVVAPDAYASIRKQISEKGSFERLQARVRDATGMRLGRRYKRWLHQENTWNDLVARNEDAHRRLVDALTEAETRGIFRQRSPNRPRALELVNATIGYFLPTLDPSFAVAVADARQEERHREALARFDARSSYEDRLAAIPPGPRRILAEEQVDRSSAEKLVYAVTSGDPPAVIASLVHEPPDWVSGAPAQIAIALGELAQSYGLRNEAGAMFEKAADLACERHWNYTRAALQFADSDRDRCARLLDRARAAGPGSWADAVEAGLADDWDRLLSLVTQDEGLADPFKANLYATALLGADRHEDCIVFLAEAVTRFPGHATLQVRLGNLLLERSMRPGTTSRPLDQRSALDLAERARDLIRAWRGSAGGAVELACRAAIMSGDFTRVLEFGLVPPDGVALPDEAAEPEVQFAVAQAAIALGQTEQARAVADAASGFRQALLTAEVRSASGGHPDELAPLYARAWELADAEDDQVAVWLSAALSGVEPVPGAEGLQSRTDDIPLLVAAQSDLARGRLQAAIDRLRPYRHRESARRMLVGAYLEAGRVDDAVAELIDAAERFDNPEHLSRAVQILVAEGRVSDAAPLAARALPLIARERTPLRNLMHEVGVADAHNRGAWGDMEERVRAWINDLGSDPHTRWLLVQALLNQAELDAAWRVLRESGDLTPKTAFHARMWTVLHARYAPGAGTCSRILALCERSPTTRTSEPPQ